ncbi:DUF2950 domain-containing protein [Paraburkholderia phenazinium]|nr:DUF2950 domain-containing protein [Paraburkholderia phenazinium]
MNSQTIACRRARPFRRIVALGILSIAAATGSLFAPGAAAQQTFASPQQAAAALDAAWRSGSNAHVIAILGAGAERLVRSGDPVAERQAKDRLASAYENAHQIEFAGQREAHLVLGTEAWPYPIPLVEKKGGWQFDVKSGASQIIDRRIGRNELSAIDVCRVYVQAQRDYAAADPLGNERHEYARRIGSSPGTRDGLYWQAASDAPDSPLGPLVAVAEAHGYDLGSTHGNVPYRGYQFRILTRQGHGAPGGIRNYIVSGHLTGGFAMVAFPARYGDSGVMTFVVNQDGIVFEKNLGPQTAAIAQRMTEYDPDRTWKIVQP